MMKITFVTGDRTGVSAETKTLLTRRYEVQIRPDVTSLLRVFLLGGTEDGLLCWPPSSRLGSTSASKSEAGEGAAMPAAGLKLLIVRTVRSMWQSILTHHPDAASGDVAWIALVNMAWVVMESSTVSICRLLQVCPSFAIASASFSAEVSVSSPGKLFIFVI